MDCEIGMHTITLIMNDLISPKNMSPREMGFPACTSSYSKDTYEDLVVIVDIQISRILLYRELTQRKSPIDRHQLYYKIICKRCLNALCLNPDIWKTVAFEWSSWWYTIQKSTFKFEESIAQPSKVKRQRKENQKIDRQISTKLCMQSVGDTLPFAHRLVMVIKLWYVIFHHFLRWNWLFQEKTQCYLNITLPVKKKKTNLWAWNPAFPLHDKDTYTIKPQKSVSKL